tara:strand:- start:57 stop:242 length:186 start_codon:yes stop_codon:yes gene_type:complete
MPLSKEEKLMLLECLYNFQSRYLYGEITMSEKERTLTNNLILKYERSIKGENGDHENGIVR